jgi:orotate phosphoribosyltransferase-like protein
VKLELSPRQRAVLELGAQGFRADQIAERLGISRDTVYSTRARAMEKVCPKPVPVPCERCGEDPAMTAGLCGFCHEELAE